MTTPPIRCSFFPTSGAADLELGEGGVEVWVQIAGPTYLADEGRTACVPVYTFHGEPRMLRVTSASPLWKAIAVALASAKFSDLEPGGRLGIMRSDSDATHSATYKAAADPEIIAP